MHIHFPQEQPEYLGSEFGVAFAAVVNGERIACRISAEALEDHFGAPSSREDDLLRAFIMHRVHIEHAAQRMLKEIGAKPLLLHSGYFRFCE